PAHAGRLDHRRATRHQRVLAVRRGEKAHAASARAGGPAGARGRSVPPRVLRRTASADRDRARPLALAQGGRARRAGLGARRVDPRPDPEPPARPPGAARRLLPLHRARPRRGRAHEPHDRGDVPREDRRDRRCRHRLEGAEAPVHAGAVLGGAAVAPGRAARRDHPGRRGAEPDRAAGRMPLPSALPPCAPAPLEYLLASAATRAANAVPIPVNHRLVAEEVSYILEHSDAVAAFVGGPYVAMAEEVRRHAARVRLWITLGSEHRPWATSLDELLEQGGTDYPAVDPAQGLGGSMIYTGGTTGKPKGALRAASDAQTTLTFMQALGMMHDDHAHLVAGPLYHSAPRSFALFAALLGGTVVVMPRFDPEQALYLIDKHRITSTFMAPTLIKRIVDLPESVRARYDVSSMRSLIVAAAPCPMRVKEAALGYFGPCLYEFYGSTELGINTILRPEDVLRKPGSCGQAAPNIEIALLDDEGRPVPTGEPGEVSVRRFRGMFDAYYKNSEATVQTERDGW